MVSPDAGNFVKQRLGRMGILKHIAHGEIGNQVGMGEGRKGHIDEHELHERGGNGGRNHLAVAALSADQRHESLKRRNGERQDEGEMSDLGNHGPAPLPSCQTPFSFSLSATSLGM